MNHNGNQLGRTGIHLHIIYTTEPSTVVYIDYLFIMHIRYPAKHKLPRLSSQFGNSGFLPYFYDFLQGKRTSSCNRIVDGVSPFPTAWKAYNGTYRF